MKKASIMGILISSILMPTVQLIGAVGTALMIVYGGISVVSGLLRWACWLPFFSYVTQFNAPLAEAADLFAEFISAQAAAERIFGLLEEESEIKDKDEVIKNTVQPFVPQMKNGRLLRVM